MPTMMPTFFYVFGLFGVAVFAISGALAAARREMDIFGFIVVGLAPAVGGGTLRDLLLDARPVFWIGDPTPIYVAVIAAIVTYFMTDHLQSRFRALLWADALGLALFTILGVEKALLYQVPAFIAIVMGVMTAVAGGIVRDVLCGEIPLILRKEIYAIPAALGGAVYYALLSSGLSSKIAFAVGFAAILTLRGLAIRYGWTLPPLKKTS